VQGHSLRNEGFVHGASGLTHTWRQGPAL